MDDSICIAKLNYNGASTGISPNKIHLHSTCTSLENTLIDRKRKYTDKVQALFFAWEQIANFVETSAESPQPFFDFLFLNTLRFVLRADWEKTVGVAQKTHLGVILQRIIKILNKSQVHHSILEQSRVLHSLVKDPWNQKALNKILNSQDVDLNDCVEYFKVENGKIVTVRLEMLLVSKCEDLAINLSKACINANNHFNEDLEEFDTLDFNQDEIDYITDIYFCCLSKKKRNQEIIDEIKKYQIDDGLRLLQRYRLHSVGGKFKERCKSARVWKCNDKLIHLLTETLLAKAVLHADISESQSQLEELIKEWATVRTVDGVLPTVTLEMIRKFVLIARSSKHIYPFCSLLIHNGNCKEQYFNMVARCLIRAINQNMNEVEQHRTKREREKLKETYCQLSKGFLLLSELLEECHNIYKECLLTSFSLTPTRECLQTIEAFITQLANAADSSEGPQSEQSSIDSGNPVMEKHAASDENIAAVEPLSVPPEDSSQPSKAVLRSPSPSKNSCPNDSTNINHESETLSIQGVPNSETSVVEPSSITKESDTNGLNETLENVALLESNIDQIHRESDAIPESKQIDCKKGSSFAYINELENLKLEEDMGNDLNIILSYRRKPTLTWDLEWTELKANCEKHLENFEKTDFDDIELKYLDLDYNLFKDKPINYDDTYGIEKGYEQFAFSPADSEEEVSSTKKSGVSSIDSDEDVVLSLRKRKKVISSDSDEPRRKKIRGRKPKHKLEELQRRTSLKSDTASNPEDSVDSVIESVIAKSSNAQNLKELRSFRITSMKSIKSANNRSSFIDDNHNESISEEVTKKWEELNDYLADSCKSLESIEITPIPPRFNVYEVILDETLVPIDSDKRLPKCEDLLINNENIFPKNIPSVKSSKRNENPRKSSVKEKKPNSKKKCSKLLSSKTTVNAQSTESYSPHSSNQRTPQSTLLSNDDLFKRKYGTKQKTEEKLPENQSVNYDNVFPVVQLPKLSETFGKKSFVMKPIDQNVSCNTSATYCYDKSSISQPLFGCSNQDLLNGNSFSQTSTNSINSISSGENIEDIQNFIASTSLPNYTPTHGTNTPHIIQHQKFVENTCQTDFSSSDDDCLQQLLNNVPSNSTNGTGPLEPQIPFSAQGNVSEVTPTVSTFASISYPTIDQSASVMSTFTSGVHSNNISPKKTEVVRINHILNDYTTTITAHPELKNIPAPRKRNKANNTPRKPRSRAKKNTPVTSESDGHLSHVEVNTVDCTPPPVSQEINPSMFNGNTAVDVDSYCGSDSTFLYDTSPAKLPIVDGSSQLIRIPKPGPGYYGPIPSFKTKIVSSNGVTKNVLSHTPNVLKTLLTQGTAANQRCSSSVFSSSAGGTQQTASSVGQVLQQNIRITRKYNDMNTTHSTAVVSQPSYSAEFMNQSSQQSEMTQILKRYGGLSNNFEVRLSRIDCKPNVASHSTNNVRTTNKSNLASVSPNFSPKVVLPMLPITESMFNMSSANNFQVRNNFNTRSAAASNLSMTTEHIPENLNNYQSVNDGNMMTVLPNIEFPSNSHNVETTVVQPDSLNMNSHFSPDFVLSTDISNFKNENTQNIVYATVEGSNTISSSENSSFNDIFSTWTM